MDRDLYLKFSNKRVNARKEGIDLMKYGWVTKVSNLLDITHTQVRRFMKAHYTGEYFIRKRGIA